MARSLTEDEPRFFAEYEASGKKWRLCQKALLERLPGHLVVTPPDYPFDANYPAVKAIMLDAFSG